MSIAQQKMKSLKRVLQLSLALMPFLGSALASEQKITVGALRFTSHAATFVAYEKGYFKEQGLDVELKFFQAAQPMAVAVASKDVDYAITAMSGGLVSLADKGAIKIIGGSVIEDASVFGQKILVSDQAYKEGVTDPSKLDGRSWAITQSGSSFHYVGSKIMEKEGITLHFKPLQKVGTIIGSMKTNQVDAWSIVPDIAKSLTDTGNVHIIGNVSDYLPDYQVTTIFTSTTNAEQNIEMTKAFLTAIARGAEEVNTTLIDKTAGEQAEEETLKLIHKYINADQPFEKARQSILNGLMRLSPNAALNEASLQDQLSWFQKEGLIKPDIQLSTIIDRRYIDQEKE